MMQPLRYRNQRCVRYLWLQVSTGCDRSVSYRDVSNIDQLWVGETCTDLSMYHDFSKGHPPTNATTPSRIIMRRYVLEGMSEQRISNHDTFIGKHRQS